MQGSKGSALGLRLLWNPSSLKYILVVLKKAVTSSGILIPGVCFSLLNLWTHYQRLI